VEAGTEAVGAAGAAATSWVAPSFDDASPGAASLSDPASLAIGAGGAAVAVNNLSPLHGVPVGSGSMTAGDPALTECQMGEKRMRTLLAMVAAGLVLAALSGIPAQAAPIAPLTAGITADFSDVTQASWRRC
jgi:hypothetical protein